MMAVALPALLWFTISEQHSGKMPHWTRSIFVKIKNMVKFPSCRHSTNHISIEKTFHHCARKSGKKHSHRLTSMQRKALSLLRRLIDSTSSRMKAAAPSEGERSRRAAAAAGAAPGRGAQSTVPPLPFALSPPAALLPRCHLPSPPGRYGDPPPGGPAPADTAAPRHRGEERRRGAVPRAACAAPRRALPAGAAARRDGLR